MQRLLILLFIKAVILAIIISTGSIGLAPDEAQYWTWSQNLDWGYYSKPPGIAWQIWITTSLFGNSVLGIRLGALIIGFCLSLAVFAAARAANLEKKIAFWAAVAMAFSPLGVYLSFAATTDGGAILFLTLAIAAVMAGPRYVLAGFFIFLGALFKWTVFIFWPVLLVYFIFFKNLRRWNVFWGILLSLLAFLPSLYWNMSHEWATFRHVTTAVGEVKRGNFFDYLGAQIGLLSPVFFILLIASYFFLRKANNRSLWFAAGFPLVALLFLGAALFKKMQPNWAAFLYPPGFVLIGWTGYQRKLWLYIGTWLSIVMVTALFTMAWLPVPYKLNPFRQSVGWQNLDPALQKAGYQQNQHFLFADKYQAASLLSFYGPGQKRAYFFNVSATRKNQFSYWPQMDKEEKGKTGYFVILENTSEKNIEWYRMHYENRLAPYFSSIHYKGAYPLYSVSNIPVKYAIIFECAGYSGAMPQLINKY